jgi:hypothetical protein
VNAEADAPAPAPLDVSQRTVFLQDCEIELLRALLRTTRAWWKPGDGPNEVIIYNVEACQVRSWMESVDAVLPPSPTKS